MNLIKKPWELGEPQSGGSDAQTFSLPNFCVGDHILVKLAPPRGQGVRDGLVATILMESYYDRENNEIKLVEYKESASGYAITFPFGKRSLIATKYRGPKSQYRYLDREKNQWYVISNDRFTLEGAISYCEENVEGWAKMSDVEKDQHLDEYFQDMYMFAISQDLALPVEDDEYTEPVVGLRTKLYRSYTPPSEGERYGNIIISKWHKGQPSLDGTYDTIPEDLAQALYEEYQVRDMKPETFDPTQLEDDENGEESEII